MAYTFNKLKDEYDALWRSCVIRQERKSEVMATARRIISNRPRYEEVSKLTDGVPWWFIGLIHNMECSLDFGKHLHNGDSLKKRTWREPKGRPLAWPPNGQDPFVASAVDALTMKGKEFHKVKDWSIAHVAFMLEMKFNGPGYRLRKTGIHSPYLWSFTNLYERGKFIEDHVYSPTAVSEQCGSMAVLKAIAELDPQAFDFDAPAPTTSWPKAGNVDPVPPPAAVVAAVKTAGTSRSVWSLLTAAFFWLAQKLEAAFDLLPSVTGDVDGQISALQSLTNILKINFVPVTTALGVVLIGIAIWRHTRDKVELVQTKQATDGETS